MQTARTGRRGPGRLFSLIYYCPSIIITDRHAVNLSIERKYFLQQKLSREKYSCRSRTMHHQLPPLTIGGTVLKESDDFVILEVTFDSKMTFEKHLRSVSRAASQRLGILRKS